MACTSAAHSWCGNSRSPRRRPPRRSRFPNLPSYLRAAFAYIDRTPELQPRYDAVLDLLRHCAHEYGQAYCGRTFWSDLRHRLELFASQGVRAVHVFWKPRLWGPCPPINISGLHARMPVRVTAVRKALRRRRTLVIRALLRWLPRDLRCVVLDMVGL